MRLGRLELSGGALLVIALLFYLDRDGMMLWFAISCGLHELGHGCAIHLLGGKIRKLRVSCVGVELQLSQAEPLSAGQMCLAALAGPTVNFLLCAVGRALARRGAGAELYLFAALNLGLGSFNLLPVNGLDGGWAVRGVLCRWGGAETAERVLRVTTQVTVLFLLCVGAILMWQSGGRSFTVFLAGAWLFCCQRRGDRE